MDRKQNRRSEDELLQVANRRKAWPRWQRVSLWIVACIAFWVLFSTGGIYLIYLAVKDSIPPLPELEQYR